MKKPAAAHQTILPSWGEIKGGQLHGWHFHVLQVKLTRPGLRILARCTPPRWPFPLDVPLAPKHFMQLRAVSGERAKKWPAAPMIANEYRRLGLEPPAWLEWRDRKGRERTLRALLLRSQQP